MPTIIIDSREQAPLRFEQATKSGTLVAGDYSLAGLEELAAIERKSLPDLVACCCATNRDRFKRELHRLQSYRCRAVVIEAPLSDALKGAYRSDLHPNALLAAVASWQIRYAVPFVWADSPAGAARVTLELLRQFHRQCCRFATGILADLEKAAT